jgi:hypothetical protein
MVKVKKNLAQNLPVGCFSYILSFVMFLATKPCEMNETKIMAIQSNTLGAAIKSYKEPKKLLLEH